MLTIKQYNKIIHDWIVKLTGISGSNVRPQKNQFGFNLVEDGKPIAFDSTVCMFYVGFSNTNVTSYYDLDTNNTLKTMNVTITIIGDSCDQDISQIQSLAMTESSRSYLAQYGIAIQGRPTEMISDGKYSKKWFYRRTLQLTMNVKLDFSFPNTTITDIVDADFYIKVGNK